MALYNFGIAPTSVCLRFKLFDSSSAVGAGLTGLAYGTSNLKIAVNQLVRDGGSGTAYLYTGANIEDISTLGVWASPSGGKCRFKEVDATNQPGVYELQILNSICASSGNPALPLSLLVSIGGAVTNLAQQDFVVECSNQNVDKTGYALTSAYDAAKNAASEADLATVDGVVDAIKAKTDNLPASPAAVGSAMTLADDAITAGKFDETTAFPLASADTGASAVARVGADNDTLETLSDQIDAVKSSVDGISNVTRLSVALFEYLQRPASGSKYVKVEVALKDNAGAMEDPDGNQLALTVYNPAGTSRNSLLYKDGAGADALADGSGTFSAYKKMEKEATGLYFFYYKVTHDATEEELTFKFGWEESSAALYEYRASQVCDAANDLSAIRLQTDKIPASPAAVGSAMTLATDAVNAAALAADAVAEIQSGLSTLDAADIRSAVGLASANLDTQLEALPTAAENRAEMDANSTKLANLDASVSSRGTADPGDAMTLTAAYDAAKTAASAANLAIVDGIVDDILVDTAAIDLRLPVSPAAVGSAMTLSSGERLAVADSVWDEILSGHSLAGSAGLALSNAGGALDAAGTAAAVWGALRATYSGAGTFGEYTRASLERVAGSATVDTLTITAWFETILAHAAGDVVRSVNTYDYKKQDGVTTAFSFTSSAGGRS